METVQFSFDIPVDLLELIEKARERRQKISKEVTRDGMLRVLLAAGLYTEAATRSGFNVVGYGRDRKEVVRFPARK